MKPIEITLEEVGINFPQDGFMSRQEDDLFILTLWADEVSVHTAVTTASFLPGTVLGFQQFDKSADADARFELTFDPTLEQMF